MTGWHQRLAVFAAALWWGSLTAVGAWVVPLLFAKLPTPALAGQTAAVLFSAQAWVAIGCGLVLLLSLRGRGEEVRMDAAGGALVFVLCGMLLALLSEFAVAPRIVARQDLRLWHGVGTVMFVLQWGCAATVLWKSSRRPREGGDPDLTREAV